MTNVFQKLNFLSKLPNVSSSIFSVMSELAVHENAINLSQGFPDFDCDPKLIEFIHHHLVTGKNQYAPMPGILSLRQTIAEKIEYLYHQSIDPVTEITITAGGTQAIFTVIASMINPGDEVLIFEPAYDSYRPCIELFGGKVVSIKLKAPEFNIDWDEVNTLMTSKTKLIIINNPNNPTGQCLTTQDIQALERIVQNKGVFILSDEVYEHLVFDQQRHLSLLTSEILRQITFVVASFGKLVHATGWKMGYVVAPVFLTSEFRKIHQYQVFSVNTPIQHALNDYLQDRSVYLGLNDFFQNKRDYLFEALKTSKLKPKHSAGTYFLLVDYSQLSDEDELTFAKRLTKDYKVASIPVSAFYQDGYNQQLLRLCFAKKQETLMRAVDNILTIK